jgi:hypothetical protein
MSTIDRSARNAVSYLYEFKAELVEQARLRCLYIENVLNEGVLDNNGDVISIQLYEKWQLRPVVTANNSRYTCQDRMDDLKSLFAGATVNGTLYLRIFKARGSHQIYAGEGLYNPATDNTLTFNRLPFMDILHFCIADKAHICNPDGDYVTTIALPHSDLTPDQVAQ